jgi:hypothetical protein
MFVMLHITQLVSALIQKAAQLSSAGLLAVVVVENLLKAVKSCTGGPAAIATGQSHGCSAFPTTHAT